jgi:5-(carboxyamino)imidazole ribonucleotide mutase
MEKAGAMLDEFGIGHETRVLSAHKTPDEAIAFAENAAGNGFGVILATGQMPTGIPVARVAIDGATNAALLAVSILAVGDEDLTAKLAEYRKDLAEKTLAG